jgi:hypothetical protein
MKAGLFCYNALSPRASLATSRRLSTDLASISMPPPRTRLDPQGYYTCLGVDPVATQAAIVAAFRAKARLLHPDVPKTGNAAAFVAVKQAYDVLSHPDRRAEYDRKASEAVEAYDRLIPDPLEDPVDDEDLAFQTSFDRPAGSQVRIPRIDGVPVLVWAALGAFLLLCVYQAASHLVAPSSVVNAGIRPNAATVEPLSPSAHRAVLYGPSPVRLAGTPNFYVIPAGSPAVLWRHDADRNVLVPAGQLPPFSAVQAVRLIRQTGMLEVLVNASGNGFISADHLAPGNAEAARAAYCSYNSGPTPFDGELLERRGSGGATLVLANRAMQPAVVKLRDAAGTVVAAVFLGPGSRVQVNGLPEGLYRPEFAIGEVWSRACNLFAAGMRARRMDAAVELPGETHIVVAPDGGEPAASDISDQAFEQN